MTVAALAVAVLSVLVLKVVLQVFAALIQTNLFQHECILFAPTHCPGPPGKLLL